LAKEPFLLFQEDTYMRQLILEECSRHGFTPQIRFSSRQIETILSLVEQNAGVGFLPADITRKHPRIVSRPLTPPLSIQAGFAWNEERYLSQACHVLLDFCEERTANKI
jgi:DNA-binding transcriptional LysR family regulator